MNVLVYAGPEILQVSLSHALSGLRSILVPHYTVQSITQHTLTTQPWQNSCALLVLPRSRNPFLSVASKYIKEYVEGGGAYLMIGAGASAIPRSGGLGIGSRGLSLGLEAGETPLKFFAKLDNCYITCDEEGDDARDAPCIVTLRAADGTQVNGIYDTGVAKLKGFEDLKGVTVQARYSSDGTDGVVAGVVLDVSKGRISLWGPSIEYPLSEERAGVESMKLSPKEIETFDEARRKLLVTTLLGLGLHVPVHSQEEQAIARPLPQFLTSIPSKPTIVSQITNAIAMPQSGDQLTEFKDANDIFHFHPIQEILKILKSSREASSDPGTWQPKHIIVCPDGMLPTSELTPLFNLDLFYKVLAAAREKLGSLVSSPWGMGDALLYGEVVTSTQTMLDKNPRLLAQLPTPLLSLASYQLAGRGRGSNIWLSPSGCLQFSLHLRVSLDALPPNKLVFVQYLFSLAVVEACRDESVLGPKAGENVRLKWPNDLYATTGMGKDALKKIGGVLINTSFQGGKADIVIGCGLNVLNLPPMTSLSQLIPASRPTLSMEKTAAAIMAKFETMWSLFIRERGSFAAFIDLYLQRWLHYDQLVTLTTTNPHTSVRITGITLEHGLLRTMPERSGLGRYSSGGDEEYIDLQPDGNSFDLMANLIKTKS